MEYSVDDYAFTKPIVMTPTDGIYDELSEEVQAVIDTSNLTAGTHTVYVRGIDKAGNIESPVSKVFVIDTTPPIVEILLPKEGQIFTIADTILIEISAEDFESGIKNVYAFVFSPAIGEPMELIFDPETGHWKGSIPACTLEAGTHKITVEVVNGAGLGAEVWTHFTKVIPKIIHVIKDNLTPDPEKKYPDWATAAKSIQDALDVAISGDTIVVRTEEYLEWGLKMKSGVTLVSEAALQITGIDTVDDSRVTPEDLAKFKPEEQLPKMPGIIEKPFLTPQGEEVILPQIFPVNEDTIIYSIDNDINTHIIGFNIWGGVASYGGAIKCKNSKTRLIFNHLKYSKGKKAGGGIYILNSPVTIYNNSFYINEAGRGSGICAEGTSDTIKISNSIFTSNEANILGGGAIYVKDSKVEMKDCIFKKNESSSKEVTTEDVAEVSGIPAWLLREAFSLGLASEKDFYAAYSFGSGGAIFIRGKGSELKIDKNIIGEIGLKNESKRDGGGIEAIGDVDFSISLIPPKAEALLIGGPKLTIEDTHIKNNIAIDDGGGISFTARATGTIKNTEIKDNIAKSKDGGGGGLHITARAEVTLEGDVKITHNIAENKNGGGIYIRDSSSLKIDGGIISRNKAKENGGGIFTGRLEVAKIFAAVLESYTSFVIAKNTIEYNRIEKGEGGGIAIIRDEPGSIYFNITGNKIFRNYISATPIKVEPPLPEVARAPVPFALARHPQKIEEIMTGPAGGIYLKDAHKPTTGLDNVISDSVIEENTVSGIKSVDSTQVGNLYEIKGNHIIKNYIGITIHNGSPAVIGNKIMESDYYGIQLVNSYTWIEWNHIVESGKVQIEVAGRSNPKILNANIVGNRISRVGIYVYEKAFDIPPDKPDAGYINKCNIFGHKEAGLFRKGTEVTKLNAKNNWWGDKLGPQYPPDYPNPKSEGDRIIGKEIEFKPCSETLFPF